MAKNLKDKLDLKTPDELLDQIVGEFVDEITKLTIRLISEEQTETFEDAARTRDLIALTIRQTKLFLEALSQKQIGEQLQGESEFIAQKVREEFDNLSKGL